jgi:choline kinase/ubiquinone/menaquinone biosynthesis C-methylase UbiE
MYVNAINPQSPAYRAVKQPRKGNVTTAVVCAASRLTALDHPTGPKCMYRLGEMTVIEHLITQLAHAGMKKIVVLCGYMGDKLQALIQTKCILPTEWGVSFEFVQLGDAFQQGMCRSILMAKDRVKEERFLLVMADHIFDPDLIVAVADKKVKEICVLVERDHNGLVGMPSAKVNGVKLTGETVTSIQTGMVEPDGIDAGVFAVDQTIFETIAESYKNSAYVHFCEVLQAYVKSRRLVALSTDSLMWFAIESRDALLEAANQEVLSALCATGAKKKWNVAKSPGGANIEARSDSTTEKEDNSDWASFPVAKWQNAVYINRAYFGQLIEDQKVWVTDVAKHLKLCGRRVTLIDVGSGTGEFVWPLVNDFRAVIGIDFNKNFIDYCKDATPVEQRGKVHFVEGDATQLVKEMQDKAPAHIWDDAKIVACVGNTFGIFPDSIKSMVYQQMAQLAGPDGFVLIGYWNAKCFGDAVQNFYYANPALCGKFTGENVDFGAVRLTTPTGYSTHWTSVDEARQVLQSEGLEEVDIMEKGKGVLVTARLSDSAPREGFSPRSRTKTVQIEREEDLRAQAYYDSDDAFNFYYHVWGGECIHVGLYEPTPSPKTEVVLDASLKSLERLFSIRAPQQGATIMDMGSAYGGNARYAARTFSARVSCVDLSAKENRVNEQRTKDAGLEGQVWINGERSFTQTGEPDESFDLVTSQDSFLHAGQYRAQAIAEAARVLKPGGYLVFTDIMQSETCNLEQMGPVFRRIHLDDMGSVSKYKRWGEDAGLTFEEFEDHTDQLPRHYGTVRAILSNIHSSGTLTGKVSAEFVDKMVSGLASWVEQAGNNNLAWGYVVFRKEGSA